VEPVAQFERDRDEGGIGDRLLPVTGFLGADR